MASPAARSISTGAATKFPYVAPFVKNLDVMETEGKTFFDVNEATDGDEPYFGPS